MLRPLLYGTCAAGAVLFCSVAQAGVIAFDSAQHSAYDSNWGPGTNGGFGWGGAWVFRDQSSNNILSTSSSRGWFMGSSRGNNGSTGNISGHYDINTPYLDSGRAWGLYANNGNFIHAVRELGSPLQVGQTLSWYMDNGSIDTNGLVGMRLLTNASNVDSRTFEFRFIGGQSNYEVWNNATTAIPWNRHGLSLDYTLTSASTFSLKVTRLSDGFTQTINGNNASSAPIVALAFKNQFAGSGSGANAYLNSIQIAQPPVVDDLNLGFVFRNGDLLATLPSIDPAGDPLTWTLESFVGPGGPVSGASVDPTTGEISWPTAGQPLGAYTAVLRATDPVSLSDTGTLTFLLVPEPATIWLLGLALAAIGRLRRR